MKHYCLALGLISYVIASNQQSCRFFQYNVRSPGGQINCVNCPMCPGGHEPVLKCAVRTVYTGPVVPRCRKCPSGTYKRGNGPTPCRPCIKCAMHRVVLQNCTRLHPGECAEHCIPGYYLDHDHYCAECCPCLGQSNDEIEPQCAGVPGKKCRMNSIDGICKTKPASNKRLTAKLKEIDVSSSTGKRTPRTSVYSQPVKPTASDVTSKQTKTGTEVKTDFSPKTPKNNYSDEDKRPGSKKSKTDTWTILGIIIAITVIVVVVLCSLWARYKRQHANFHRTYSRTGQDSPGDTPVITNKIIFANKEDRVEITEKMLMNSPPEDRKMDVDIRDFRQKIKENEPLLRDSEEKPLHPASNNEGLCRRRSSSVNTGDNGIAQSSGNRERKLGNQSVVPLPGPLAQVQSPEANYTYIHIDQLSILNPLRRQNSESSIGNPVRPLATLKEVEEAEQECLCGTQFGDELLADKIQGPIHDLIDCYLSKPEQCKSIFRFLVREHTPDISSITTGGILLDRLNAAVPQLRLASFIYVLKQPSIQRNDIVKAICIELHKTPDGKEKLLADSRLENTSTEC